MESYVIRFESGFEASFNGSYDEAADYADSMSSRYGYYVISEYEE